MRTIAKGKIFGITTEVSDHLLANLANTPEILQEANAAGAVYWHTGILPAHFTKEAHAKYGYAERARNYLKQRRKQGKPDLVCTWSLKNELTSRISQLKATATGAQVKLRAKVLNFVPNMSETDQNLYVTHRRRGRTGQPGDYPNLKREIKVILADEREAIAQVVTVRLEQSFTPSDYSPAMAGRLKIG